MTKHLRPLLPILVFMASCNAQEKPRTLDDGAAVATRPARLVKTQGTGPAANVHCGLQDRSGHLWFGTTGEGVYRYDGRAFTNFTERDGLSSNTVWCIEEDRSGILWFGTVNGVCRYDGRSFTPFSIPLAFDTTAYPDADPSKTSVEVYSILQDKAGGFWFGTGDRGVVRYDGTSFHPFPGEGVVNTSKLRLNAIQEMVEDKAGNIWFASWNQEGLCRYDGSELITYREQDGMVHAILEDNAGNLWIGTRNSGVLRFDPSAALGTASKTFTTFKEHERLASNGVYAMAEDRRGHIWLTTENAGVWRYDGRSFTPYTTKDGLCNNSVFCVVEDAGGQLWFGTRNVGLCEFDGSSFTDHSDTTASSK